MTTPLEVGWRTSCNFADDRWIDYGTMGWFTCGGQRTEGGAFWWGHPPTSKALHFTADPALPPQFIRETGGSATSLFDELLKWLVDTRSGPITAVMIKFRLLLCLLLVAVASVLAADPIRTRKFRNSILNPLFLYAFQILRGNIIRVLIQ